MAYIPISEDRGFTQYLDKVMTDGVRWCVASVLSEAWVKSVRKYEDRRYGDLITMGKNFAPARLDHALLSKVKGWCSVFKYSDTNPQAYQYTTLMPTVPPRCRRFWPSL